jgi:integrase
VCAIISWQDVATHARGREAGPKTINDEVQLLLRLCGEQGVLIRSTLRRDKALKLPLPASPGRPYSAEEKARMLEEAAKLRTPQMHAALALDLNTGLRDKELRQIRWEQIDLVHKKALTVGKSKTEAGTGRVIPLNETAIAAMEAHAAWYTRRFGACRPEWFVFAFGSPLPADPTRPITSFKTAWIKVRQKAGVKGRWHDNRHTLVTELAESGAGDEVIMSIAGHVSRAMLSRYSHVRMEAKRRALDEIAARQRTADEKRKAEAERREQPAAASQLALVQQSHGGQRWVPECPSGAR